MKKAIFFAAFILILTGTVSSQTEEGGIMLGTSTQIFGSGLITGLESHNNAGLAIVSSQFKSDNFNPDSDRTTVLNFSPRMGAFVATDILVGGELNFIYIKDKDANDPTTSVNFGPFLRYYFIAENFRPFAQANVSIGQTSFGKDDKANNLQFGVAVGGAFFLSEKVSADLMIGYTRSQSKEKDSPTNSRTINGIFGFGAGFSFFL